MKIGSRKKAASQKDIAQLLGVDQKTVSRVFAESASVSEDTRTRVMDAANKLGYRPNLGARAMRTGKFNTIVLLQAMSHMQSNLHTPLLQGIQDGLGEKYLTLARIPDEKLQRGETLPTIMRELSSDGVLVNYDTNIPEKMIEQIEAQPLPVVWINSKQPHDCAHPDDEQGGKLATEHLLKLGHKKIGYTDYHLKHSNFIHYSRTDRFKGYQKAMKAAGLETVELMPLSPVTAPEMAEFATREIRRVTPTALVAYDPGEAAAFMWGARALNLITPRDLSVVSFGLHVPNIGLPLTIALNPMREVGRAAAELVLRKIEKPRVKLAPTALGFSIEEGASCRSLH